MPLSAGSSWWSSGCTRRPPYFIALSGTTGYWAGCSRPGSVSVRASLPVRPRPVRYRVVSGRERLDAVCGQRLGGPFTNISGRSPASPMVTLRRVEAADSSMLGCSAAAPRRKFHSPPAWAPLRTPVTLVERTRDDARKRAAGGASWLPCVRKAPPALPGLSGQGLHDQWQHRSHHRLPECLCRVLGRLCRCSTAKDPTRRWRATGLSQRR
jgi:hypothetical protein